MNTPSLPRCLVAQLSVRLFAGLLGDRAAALGLNSRVRGLSHLRAGFENKRRVAAGTWDRCGEPSLPVIDRTAASHQALRASAKTSRRLKEHGRPAHWSCFDVGGTPTLLEFSARFRFSSLARAAALAAVLLVAPSLRAQNYWDSNDSTAGFGTATGTWAAPTTNNSTQGWSSSAAGTNAMSGTTTTNATDALNFGTGSAGLAAGTITVSGTVNANSLTFGSASGNIILSGGTITLGGTTPTITVNNTTDTISSVLAGSAGLTKNGTGNLMLTGANTYTGTTTINAGTLQIGTGTTGSIDNTSSIVNNGALIFNKNSDFIIKGMTGAGNLTANATSGFIRLGGNITQSGTVALNSNTAFGGQNGIRQSANTTITASSINITGSFASGGNDSNYQLTLDTSATNGTISINAYNGAGGHTYGGVSQVVANAGTGAVNISGAGPGTGGSWAASLTGAINISSNYTPGVLTLNATAASSITGNLTLSSSAANVWTVSPNVTMTASGILGGTGSAITKNGTGTLTMSGVNTYTGTTTINGGILQTSSTGLLGGGSYAANIANSGTFIIGANSNQTLSGVISGTGALTKNGTGTLTLSNAANTYNGSTTVNAGTLAVSGNISSSAITLNSGGVISAGTAAAAARFNAASLTINGGSGYAFTITNVGASVAGTDFDQIALSGALTLNNSAANPFTIYLNGTPTSWSNSSNYTWTIISAASQTGFNSGNFAMDFSNFGIASGNRTGLWSFTNPSAGNLALTYTAAAATSIWSGGAGNWSAGFSPSLATDSSVTFTGAGGTATNDIASGTLSSVNFITFNSTASSYTLAANAGSAGASGGTALTVRGDITNNSANAQTINMALALGSTSTGIINTASGNITIGGVISGVGSLVKQGNSRLTLSGNNTYTGATTISAGTLEVTSTGLLGGGNYSQNIANSGTFIFGSNSNQTLGGIISGSGALTKNGTGTLSLSSDNTYTGATTINAGTLQIGAGGTTGSLSTSSAITNNGTLVFNRTDTLTQGTNFASVISGTGNLTQAGAGTLTLSGNNTYTGATTINTGTLQISGSGLLGGGNYTGNIVNNGSLVYSSSGTQNLGGNITGSGALTQSAGSVYYNGTNTYSGGTTISGGVAWIGSNSSFGTGNITWSTGNSMLGFGGSYLISNNMTLNSNFTWGDSGARGALTINGVISGSGSFNADNTSGGITLNGLNTFTGNVSMNRLSSFSFNTIANAGVASALGAGSSISGGFNAYGVNLIYTGNTSASSNRSIILGSTGGGSITSNNAALNWTGNITGNSYSFLLSGTAGGGANYNELSGAFLAGNNLVIQAGSGNDVWRISGNNTHTGLTQVTNTSTMIAANANAFGTTANGTQVDTSGQLLLTGGIAVGAEALTLNSNASGTWNGYTGAALRSISGNNSWAGNITLSQATTIATDSGSNLTLSGNFSGANNLTVNSTGSTTISGIIGTSTGTLTKNGTGTLLLTANNTYTGATTINAGTLEVSSTGLLGGGSYSGNIANTGTLLLGSNSNQTLSGVISGSGAITKNGTGTLTISNAASTYNGTLTINTGRISAGTAAASAKINAGSLTIGAGTGYDFTISSVSSSVAGTDYDQIALTGAANFNNTAASQFTVYLNGTAAGWSNTAVYSWDIISAASQTGFTAGNFTLNDTNFGIAAGNRTGTWTFTNPSAGIIQLTYTGSTGNSTWSTGTASWGTAGSWVENTTPVNFNNLTFNGTGGGTATNNISNGTLTTVNNITFASGAGAYTLAANAGSAGASGGTALIVTGTITNNSTNAQTLSTNLSFAATRTVNTASGNITLSGVVSGAGGLAKTGANTLILSGNNTYSGVTTISAGTLSINSTGLLGGGNYSQAISNSGAIIFGSNSNQTLGGVISGTGALTKNGTGTLTLTNSANSYTGTTTINAGAVAIGANMSIGAIAGSGNLSVGSGFTLTTNSSSTTAHSGVISGSGGLTKTGTGTLTLNGSSTYSGTTTLSAGTLNINSAAAIGTGTLTITGGTIDNTSSASQTLANNNAQNWNGDFSFNGTKDLNLGTGAVTMNAARTVTVSNGILTVGGAISGANLGLTKNGTGTLMLSGNSTYTGTTTVNSGTLSVFKTGSLGGNGSVTIGPAGTLSVDSSSRTMSNNITLSGGTLRGGFQSSYGTGGTITVSGTLVTHVFTSNGTLVLPNAVSASELLVGGGGGAQAFAGWYHSGGGGGQVLNLTSQSLSAGNTTITVGAGGVYGSNGSATSIGSNTAAAGRVATVNGAGGTSGSGMAGGAGTGVANGGGGGDSAVGGVGTNPITGGAGGAGSANTAIQGLTGYGQSANGVYYFGGGGGGGAQNAPASVGGLGGGGGAGVNGTANTGGGAGGGATQSGGSGLAVVQYAYGYAAGNLTLAGTLDVQSASTLDVYTNGSLLNITGLMQTTTGSGGITIASSLTSGGIVRYSNAMTYAGDTTINSGAILQMNATNAMTNGAGKGNLILTGTLDLNGQSGTTINGLSGNGVIDNTSGAGTYTLSVGGNNTSGTFDGIIKNTTGSLALTKNGTGTLTLSGNNTYNGTTTLNAGTVVIGHANGLGTTGNITFGGGALQYGSGITQDLSSRIKNSSSAILIDTNSNNVTFASAVDSTNSGGFTKNGTGTLTLNATNTYTGTTTINGGTLQIGSAGLLGSGNYSGNIANSGSFVFGSNSNQTLSGNISGTGSLTKNGTGTLTLTGSNNYSGGTTLNAGTLVIGNTAAAGSGSINQTSSGSLLKVDVTGTINNAMSYYTMQASRNATLAGAQTVNNASFNVDDNTTLTITGNIGGNGGVTKNGGGMLTLNGTNTYNGSTVINAGTLNANSTNALGSNNTVQVNGGTLLVTVDDAINGKNIELGGSGVGLRFSGTYSGAIGNLTLSANSIIDLGTGSVQILFQGLNLSSHTLSFYNWNGTTLWNGGNGTTDTDKVYFGPDLSDEALAKIYFYSGPGDSFLGSGYDLGLQETSWDSGLDGYHIIPVPEPETWATGILLVLGSGVWLWRKRKNLTTQSNLEGAAPSAPIEKMVGLFRRNDPNQPQSRLPALSAKSARICRNF